MTAGATSTAELETIARAFPMRDRRGYVTGYYVYRRGINSGREAGPFATLEEAETAREGVSTMETLDIVCGHVFTSRGTIVRHLDVEAGGAGPVTVGDAASLA